jgi:nucleoside-diphosphate-sugar epimerase
MILSSTSASPTLPCRFDAVDEWLSEPTTEVLGTVAALRGTLLVLGAGGKMGLHLTLMLAKAVRLAGSELRVIAVSRFKALRERECFAAAGVETLACDLSNPAEVRALPDASTVFFLAGVKFGTGSSPELLQRMNVTMPRIVAERFRGARIVAFSTGCVYPFVPTGSSGATERTAVDPVGAYATSCLRREEAFAAVARNCVTPVVLIRLNYAVEFRYGVLVDIAARVFSRQPVDVTMGHVNVIWQSDALAHIIRALDLARAPAVPLNVTGPDVLSVRQLAVRFGELFGIEPGIENTEAPTAWLNDASHAHRMFGPPPTSVESMMIWIAAWLQQGGQTWGKPTGFEKRDGNF